MPTSPAAALITLRAWTGLQTDTCQNNWYQIGCRFVDFTVQQHRLDICIIRDRNVPLRQH